MVTIITWACLSIQGAVGQGVRIFKHVVRKAINEQQRLLLGMGECGWIIIAHARVGYSVYTTATTSTNNPTTS